MIWSCLSIDKDLTEQYMSHPSSIYQVYQVLARISGNNYTGCEQCACVTTWTNLKRDCRSRTNWLAYGNEGYISNYWRLAVSANHHLEEDNDKGEAWVCKTVMSLWDFAHDMWSIATQYYMTCNLRFIMPCKMLKLMMRLPSCMKRWICIQQRIDGTLMFHYDD